MAILAIVFDKDIGRFLAQSIGTAQLQNQAITSALVAAGAIGGPHVASGAILPPINISGKLGVGVTSSAATLHVKPQGSDIGVLTLESTYTGTTTPISLIPDNPGNVMSFVIQKGAGYRPPGYANLLYVNMAGNITALLSGNITTPGRVDSVDVSAHTHTGGAGDAANIQSGGIGAGQIGTPHLTNQAITSALVAAGILATPHMQNQGILSASIGAQIVGGSHLNLYDTWPGRTFDGSIGLLSGRSLILSGVRTLSLNQEAGSWVFRDQSRYDWWWAVFGPDLVDIVRDGGIRIVSGNVTGIRFDSVDISAHTHTGGDGDAGGIASAGIVAAAIGTPHIANQAITSALIMSGTIGGGLLQDFGVTSGKIASGSIDLRQIGLGAPPVKLYDQSFAALTSTGISLNMSGFAWGKLVVKGIVSAATVPVQVHTHLNKIRTGYGVPNPSSGIPIILPSIAGGVQVFSELTFPLGQALSGFLYYDVVQRHVGGSANIWSLTLTEPVTISGVTGIETYNGGFISGARVQVWGY